MVECFTPCLMVFLACLTKEATAVAAEADSRAIVCLDASFTVLIRWAFQFGFILGYLGFITSSKILENPIHTLTWNRCTFLTRGALQRLVDSMFIIKLLEALLAEWMEAWEHSWVGEQFRTDSTSSRTSSVWSHPCNSFTCFWRTTPISCTHRFYTLLAWIRFQRYEYLWQYMNTVQSVSFTTWFPPTNTSSLSRRYEYSYDNTWILPRVQTFRDNYCWRSRV